MSFFKSMWKSSGKHHKLETGDEKCLAKDLEGEPSIMPDAATFTVKYLGSTVVSNNVTTAIAVDTIMSMVKVSKRKVPHVSVTVTLNGIMVTDCKSGSLILDASVYRISNCATDPVRSNIFTFFATDKYDVTECHAFRCPKRKMAEAITLTVAHSFKTAFEVWQRGHQVCTKLLEEKTVETGKCKTSTHGDVQLIDLSESSASTRNLKRNVPSDNSSWVIFENDKDDISRTRSSFNRNVHLIQPAQTKESNNILVSPQKSDKFDDNFVWT